MDSSVIIVAIVCATIVVVTVVLMVVRRQGFRANAELVARGSANAQMGAQENGLRYQNGDADSQELAIVFEEIATLSPSEEDQLVEIQDSALIARIDSAIPVFAYGAASAAAINATSTVGTLYRAVIPAGAELANSTVMEGAKRGFYHGANGISGHANFVAADAMTGGLAAVNIAGNVMSVASMVVGQYYMAQIDNRLASIEKGTERIVNFQNTEYRSRVMALVAAIQRCSAFKVETLENDELRGRELNRLQDLELECAQLLGQANLALQGYANEGYVNGRLTITFEEYEKALKEADAWYDYQQILLAGMNEIAELTYVLNLGMMSRENSRALVQPYTAQAEDVRRQISDWHGDAMESLKIDDDYSRRRKQGFGDVVMALPGLFNDDLHYEEINPFTAKRIAKQLSTDTPLLESDGPDLYHKDVQIIKKGGKTYYLPSA